MVCYIILYLLYHNILHFIILGNFASRDADRLPRDLVDLLRRIPDNVGYSAEGGAVDGGVQWIGVVLYSKLVYNVI